MDIAAESLGQLFIYGFEGKTLNQETKDFIQEYRPGGVILFSRNIEDPRQLLDLTAALQEASPDRPLLVTIDQEGGRVWRLPSPFTFLPEAQALGKAGMDSLAYCAAKVLAQELAAVGIHCSFAPVLDLDTNPDNPVIGDRALGSSPQEVSYLARSILLSFREHGIAGCGKHFPGHGDTDVDSHLSLPVVRHPFERLYTKEMAPYRILLKDPRRPLELIMTAHLLVPDLDPESPATMSRRILKGILRNQLGFQGLIVTDDLEMGAITESYGAEESALLSFRAGADLLMFCQTPALVPPAIDALHQALNTGRLSPGRLRRSLRRIQVFKRRLLQRLPSQPVREALFNRIGCQEHQEISGRVRSFQV